MKILAIETSCDETAVALLEAQGGFEDLTFTVLGNALFSQIDTHKAYGGVYPMLAKREHAKNLIPLLQDALREAHMFEETPDATVCDPVISDILAREPDLLAQFETTIPKLTKPHIDALAVTYGPGLEPALWVGLNFAKALSYVWDIPLIPTDHMEGHILSVLGNRQNVPNHKSQAPNSKHIQNTQSQSSNIAFPALALLVSGGHTQLVHIQDWLTYEIIGQTRDDAVGEAFDKVARMLDLPYPGGPEISRLATRAREVKRESILSLPRPMITSDDYDFSFSGLKTAVLYGIQKMEPLSETDKESIAYEFESAVIDVLVTKTERALEYYGAHTLIIGGGVIASQALRHAFGAMIQHHPQTTLKIPSRDLCTDNAVMIGIAGYAHYQHTPDAYTPFDPVQQTINADGNASLD